MRQVCAHWMFVLAALMMAVAMGRAQAATPVLYYWDFVFDQVATGDSPSGSSPWATLRVEDTGSPGEVKFTLWANLKGSGEFISALWLNINPFQAVSFKGGSVTGISYMALAQHGEDGLSNAGRSFDVQFAFPTAPPADRLANSMVATWVLKGNNLTANHFKNLSGATGNNSPLWAMIHVQGISGGQEGSGKIVPSGEPFGGVIPEPATLMLFGMGLAAPLVARWRKR